MIAMRPVRRCVIMRMTFLRSGELERGRDLMSCGPVQYATGLTPLQLCCSMTEVTHAAASWEVTHAAYWRQRARPDIIPSRDHREGRYH
jgi:hypothetical protein